MGFFIIILTSSMMMIMMIHVWMRTRKRIMTMADSIKTVTTQMDTASHFTIA